MNTVKYYQQSFFVQGMSCASCVSKIQKHLSQLESVQHVQINLATQKVIIDSTQPLDINLLLQQIKSLGYTPIFTKCIKLQIIGLRCMGCVNKTEKKLREIHEVSHVFIHPTTHQARIEIQKPINPQVLIDTIESLGYQATLLTQHQQASHQLNQQQIQEIQSLKHEFIIAVLFTLPIFIIEMGGHLIPNLHHTITAYISLQSLWYIEFILSSLTLCFAGRRFYQLGIPALWRLSPDMNSLVAIGTLSAYLYSVIATFFADWLPQNAIHVYFEATTVIITLILFGRYIEAKAKYKVSHSIEKMIDLQAKTARVYQQEQWVDVDIADIATGDLIEVRTGERIAVDGIIQHGSSYVDESMITGESMPILKTIGDSVIGGTINQTANLQVKATTVGQESVLSNMMNLIENAQRTKLPIQNIVDKITLYFVPSIIVLAIATFIIQMIYAPQLGFNFALVSAVTVLIVACPCAMGLATPVSIMLGLHRGAEQGILFHKSDALQSLQQCQLIAFDKTGTITTGKPTLTDFYPLSTKFNEHQVLQWVASIEAKSQHPIAHAIVEIAHEMNLSLLDIPDVQTITAYGLTAQIDNNTIFIGASRYMQQLGLDLSPYQTEFYQLTQQAKTPIWVAINQQLVALLAVSDPVKEDSLVAIQQLQKNGIQVAMITGDHYDTAQEIAQQLHIDTVIADVLPEGKVQAIQSLQQQYHKVAFVGDGINDAPALAQADIGIAIGTGTDIAIETADIVLMSGQLLGIHKAIKLSQATLKNIQQNLFWAFLYNILLIPIAMGLFYPLGISISPMFAAAAMALSSIFVLVNALRLRYISLDE